MTKVYGPMEEELLLHTHLEAMNEAPKWLSTLEMFMKTTLQTLMEMCIQARLEDGRKPLLLSCLFETHAISFISITSPPCFCIYVPLKVYAFMEYLCCGACFTSLICLLSGQSAKAAAGGAESAGGAFWATL